MCSVLALLCAAASASAQPGPDQPVANQPDPDQTDPDQADPDQSAPEDPYATGDEPIETIQPTGPAQPARPPQPGVGEQVYPAEPDPALRPVDPRELDAAAQELEAEPLRMPMMFNAPTGHLLPAGIILTEGGVDTGGGVTSDVRVGLGDVAEFGIGTNALINVRNGDGADPEAIAAYPTALFKMGIDEHTLFRHQPAISLGFRKSFERNHDGRTSRIAQLYLVASKSLGDKFRAHVGGVFWDAQIERDADGAEITFHDGRTIDQLRVFGGIEIEPLPKSQILLELHWVPEFVLGDVALGQSDKIELTPTFSWGVRYELADWALIESGVRVPDIKDVNLIDAQIFGQVRFVTRRFQRFLRGIRN